ncbi:hypothetical protein LJC31_02515 [Synergistaceae bacterium OttesenSCG-928-I11]|nr:hypothetical protein [Synergistaceae bacterium OttesenSCG-928-I11]
MLNSIRYNASYLAAKAQLASETAHASGGSASDNAASQATAVQKIRDAIALALLKKETEALASMQETEINETYRESGDLRKLETFDGTLRVWACEDESSTPEKPVVYLEVEENGEQAAYLVDIDSIDAASMTRFEALALMRYMQNDPAWSDLTYSDMLNAISSLFGNQSGKVETTPNIVDQIGNYCKPTLTYNRDGAYNFDSGSYTAVFEQNRELRMATRALKLQNILSSISTDSNGKKTLSGGIYL